MLEKSPRLKRLPIIAITFLTFAGIVNYLDRSTLSIANHSVTQKLGLSASQMGLLLSAFSFAYAFSQLPIGVMLDRFARASCSGSACSCGRSRSCSEASSPQSLAVSGGAHRARHRRGAAVSGRREGGLRMVCAARARQPASSSRRRPSGPRARRRSSPCCFSRLAGATGSSSWARSVLRWRSAVTSSIATAGT